MEAGSADGKRAAAPTGVSPDFWRNPRPTNENPRFVSDYFGASRLHFIGSFRARYESMMVAVARRRCVNPTVLLRPPALRRVRGERVIAHVDMDCFFASVAIVGNPELAGKCIAVCHGGGEISSCSYEAREFGVRAGMFFRHAQELCPTLQSVSYDFAAYADVSIGIYTRFYDYPGVVVEAVSVDEAFLDLTATCNTDEPAAADELVEELRMKIFADTGCRASAGIGPSKLIARIATKRAKPNGQLRVRQEHAIEFLDAMALRDLPGVGWRNGKRLEQQGIETCGQLRAAPLETLQNSLGEKLGSSLYNAVRALDGRPVEPLKPRKSIGAEVSWGVRFNKDELLKVTSFIKDMAYEVATRVEAAGAHGSKVVYKAYQRKDGAGWPGKVLGHGPCDIYTRSSRLPAPSAEHSFASALTRACLRLHTDLRIPNEDFRGVGVQVTDLLFSNLNFDHTPVPTAGTTRRIESFFVEAAREPNLAKENEVAAKAEGPVLSDDKQRREREDEESLPLGVSAKRMRRNDEDCVERGEEGVVLCDAGVRIIEETGGNRHNDILEDAEVEDEDEVRANVAVQAISQRRTLASPTAADSELDDIGSNRDELPAEWDRSVYEALPTEIRAELLGSVFGPDCGDEDEDEVRNRSGEGAASEVIASRSEAGAESKKRETAREVARREMAIAKARRRAGAQVTMTQFAQLSKLQERGSNLVDAGEFRSRPLAECIDLLTDIKYSTGARSRKRSTVDDSNSGKEKLQSDELVRGVHQQQRAGRDLILSSDDVHVLDIPSPPTLSSDSEDSRGIGTLVEEAGIHHAQIFADEDIEAYAGQLSQWMLSAAQEVRTGHVELLRGRVLELVRLRRLERACVELRTIRKFATDCPGKGWRQGFNSLLNDIQTECQRTLGFKLAVSSL